MNIRILCATFKRLKAFIVDGRCYCIKPLSVLFVSVHLMLALVF